MDMSAPLVYPGAPGFSAAFPFLQHAHHVDHRAFSEMYSAVAESVLHVATGSERSLDLMRFLSRLLYLDPLRILQVLGISATSFLLRLVAFRHPRR